MRLIFTIILLSSWVIGLAQSIPDYPNITDENGKRQGKWSVYYDENNEVTKAKEKALFYRVIEYINDKPTGITRDYFQTGQLQWEGRILEDRPEEIWDGEIISYREDGTKESSKLYRDGSLTSFSESIEWYEKELKLEREDQDVSSSDLAFTMNTLADLYNEQGLYAKAEPLFIEAKNIREETLGKKHPDYLSTLNDMAYLYKNQGQMEKSEELYIEAINVTEEILGKENSNYAGSLNNLGAFYYRQGDYAKALPLFVEAKETYEKVYGKMHPSYATSINNLATIYSKLGLLDEVEPLLIEALNIYEKTMGKNQALYANSLNNLANFYKKQGQFTKAEKLYIHAKNIEEQELGNTHPTYASTLSDFGDFYNDQNLYALAEPLYIEESKILLHQIDINFSQLSLKEKSQYLKILNASFEKFHSFVLKRKQENPEVIGEDYRIILATKGILFDSEQKIKTRILNSKDDYLIELYNDWQTQRAYLSALYGQTKEARQESGIDLKSEEQKTNQLEKQLSSRSELFATANDHSKYSWRNVQSKLKKREAAIEIVRFNYFDNKRTDSVLYMALIVTTKTKDHPELVVLENGNELEAGHHKYYKNSIQHKIEDKRSYDQYWARINTRLKGIKRIYLSQDGVYHSISLGGLLNPKNGKYLLDEIDLRIVSSTRDLITAGNQYDPNREIKLLGFPDYNKEEIDTSNADKAIDRSITYQDTTYNDTRFFKGGKIPPLPGTKTEIDNLSQIMEQSGHKVSIHISEQASEASIRSWENPMIAHIATHGYFLKDQDVAKDTDRIGGISADALGDNPLLRSGLLLANAKQAIQSGGDGVLTAYEAKGLNFDKTELVVLSACETGLGEIKNGEGVYGLQRAFQTAGAASVLMSLWTVSDDATQELMTDFYNNWLLEKHSKREAFKNAQIKLREKYPDPYYWAAFVMIGK